MTLMLLIVGWVMLPIQPAHAAIRQIEEAPGQIVYQARRTLKDQHRDSWQLIAFNRIRPDGSTSFYLRLVGFPGTAEIDRSGPLTLTNSLNQTLTAADASQRIFTDADAPEPNVGQYDLQPIMAQLQPTLPWRLRLPMQSGEAVELSLPPAFVEEWQTIANYQ
jgi:hypothetical protein